MRKLLRLPKKIVCLAQRLNNLGSVFRLTLGKAIPYTFKKVFSIEREIINLTEVGGTSLGT